MSFYSKIFLFIIISLFLLFNCLDSSYNNIFIPFKSKKLRVDYDFGEIYDCQEENIKILNSSDFINRGFYNDKFSNIDIGTPSNAIKIFNTFDNSYFSIENCQIIKQSFSESITKDKFSSSKALPKKRNEK